MRFGLMTARDAYGYRAYMEHLASGKTREEAAKFTWTAQQLEKHGLTKVTAPGHPPNAEVVESVFSR